MVFGILTLCILTAPWIAVFDAWNRRGDSLRACESLVLSLAVAPVSVSVLLWLLMMVFPGKLSAQQLFWSIASVFIATNVLFFRRTVDTLRCCANEIKEFMTAHHISRRLVWPAGAVFFGGVLGLVVWAKIIPIRGFDVIEYMLGGDMFYKSRGLVYNGCFIDPQNGFWYHTYHSFLFPLFGTWGNMLTQVLSVPRDWYFKFIMLFYCLILNLYAMVLFGKRIKCAKDIIIAICGLIFLDFIPVVFDFIRYYGIDFFRLTFFTMASVFLYRTLREPTWRNVTLLGLFASLAMAAHGLQLFFTAFILMPLPFLLFRQGVSHPVMKLAVLAGMILLIPGTHYVLMTFFGDGWLFGPDFLGIAAQDISSAQNALSTFRSIKNYWNIAFLFGFSWLLLLPIGIELLKTRSTKRFQFPEIWSGLCFLLFFALLAYYASFNFRYWYTLHPPLVIGVWCLILERQAFRTPRRAVAFAACQICLTVLCTMGFLLSHRNGTKSEPQTPTVKSEAFSPEPDNPFDQLPQGAREVIIMSKNKSLYRSAPFPVFWLGFDRMHLCLTSYNNTVRIQSPAALHQLLREKNIHYVIAEKKRLAPKHQTALIELREHFRVLFESGNYCILQVNQDADRGNP